jgi:isopentenyldiphosphate isomerase
MPGHEELFDIFDHNGMRIGTAGRTEVHQKGLWHQTFQCWIWTVRDEGPVLLFQLRHPQKDTFPGRLDISCAGHLSAGERVEDGTRELEEELGLIVDYADLTFCGMYSSNKVLADGRRDCEFCHVFLYRCDQPLSDYRLQAEEVTGLFEIPLSRLELLFSGAATSIRASGVELKQGRLIPVERSISAGDLVPHDRTYYELILRHLEQGDRDQ